MDSFLNRAAFQHVRHYPRCANALGLRWHLLVHEDDGEPSHVDSWQRELRELGRNATLILSQNVHELRGYNMAARTLEQADVIIFLQDDDEPPSGCEWLGRTLAAFEAGAFGADVRVGAVGLRRGATNGDWDDEVKRHGRASLGASSLCHPLLRAPARFVIATDLAPLAVRRTAFLEVGGFPTFLTPVGVPGVGMDTLLCILLWRSDWPVLLLPHHFARASLPPEDEARSNTRGNRTWGQYARTASYIKRTHLYNASDAWKNRTLERIHRLNRQLLTPCETTSMPRAKGAAALNDGLSVDTALNTAAVGCGAAEPSMMASYLPAAVASGAPPQGLVHPFRPPIVRRTRRKCVNVTGSWSGFGSHLEALIMRWWKEHDASRVAPMFALHPFLRRTAPSPKLEVAFRNSDACQDAKTLSCFYVSPNQCQHVGEEVEGDFEAPFDASTPNLARFWEVSPRIAQLLKPNAALAKSLAAREAASPEEEGRRTEPRGAEKESRDRFNELFRGGGGA